MIMLLQGSGNRPLFLFATLPYIRAMSSKTYTYLALGDSYTIGEGVPVYESFPYQMVQLLRKAGYAMHAAEIVAKTGWTTDELQTGIRHTHLLPSYNVVSLLIGVNNQYRGRDQQEYAGQFESLLQQAVIFADNNPLHVFVLSIPDWGVTPFAVGRDRAAIARDIDAFNAINKSIAEKYKVNYIDITPNTRQAAIDTTLLAEDQLHYSGKAHAAWATELAEGIQKIIVT